MQVTWDDEKKALLASVRVGVACAVTVAGIRECLLRNEPYPFQFVGDANDAEAVAGPLLQALPLMATLRAYAKDNNPNLANEVLALTAAVDEAPATEAPTEGQAIADLMRRVLADEDGAQRPGAAIQLLLLQSCDAADGIGDPIEALADLLTWTENHQRDADTLELCRALRQTFTASVGPDIASAVTPMEHGDVE